MGKKRNNATKKKQAAKKKKLSSAYGVSVLKGGTIARNNGLLSTNPIQEGNAHAKQRAGAPSKGNGEGSTITTAPEILDNSVSPREMGGKRPRGSPGGENDEFQRMHASLEERSLALQARNDEQRRSKKGRRKQQKKGWGNFARPSDFAPATLTLAPKSTQELVDDAADQVAQGMNEIGQSATPQPDCGESAVPGRSSLADAASLSWKLRVANASNKEEPPNQNNPFSALDEDSDSDNDWAEKKTNAVQPFQFKPASFPFQSTTVSNPSAVAAGADDDIDPDL